MFVSISGAKLRFLSDMQNACNLLLCMMMYESRRKAPEFTANITVFVLHRTNYNVPQPSPHIIKDKQGGMYRATEKESWSWFNAVFFVPL